MMSNRYFKLLVSITMLFAVGTLVSCGASGVGAIPSGTPSLGNGTLAVIPSPSPTKQSIPPASPAALSGTYAFVRNNQLWLALHGAKPAQATSFDYSNLPDVSWHQPLWSPGDGSVAFIMNARPVGEGGGGCPAPDYGANGALYILNASTMQSTQVMVPADKSDPLASSPHNGYWQYMFWQDATHLLAWYNGVVGKTSNTAGLYRYDTGKHILSQVISLAQLGVSTLFNAQQNAPLMLSMRYSSGQLYYQVVAHPFTQQSQLTIYRHVVDQPALASVKVLDMGSEAWCGSQQSNTFTNPGWDVSLDGQQLAAQMVQTGNANAPTSSIETLNMPDNTTTGLLAQLPPAMLAHDLVLTWGPDSQSLVASEAHLLSHDGPYSATLANPAMTQAYAPGAAGLAAWKTDSSAFTLQSTDMSDVTGAGQIYLFNTGDTQGQLLLTNTRNFVWG
ncbi:MAG TPA: hypothetical protein VFQ36_03315 [Ktedonobacteraceae bacterium]|nr:hypothetical protein [Ktedonobacteraceae bacterium]